MHAVIATLGRRNTASRAATKEKLIHLGEKRKRTHNGIHHRGSNDVEMKHFQLRPAARFERISRVAV